MRRMMAALAVAALGLATGGMGVMPVGAAPPDGPKAPSAAPAPDGPGSDELPNPLEEKRRELRATALDAVLAGEAVPEQRNGSEVVRGGETEGSSAPDSSTRSEEHTSEL